jgi:hypothetical protein
MMSYILTTLGIGILATLSMTTFLWIVTYFKLCEVDMVKAIGSWYTHKESNALLPGMLVHMFAGVVFTYIYLFLFSVLPIPNADIYIYAVFGAGIGFVHGIVVALCLVILVAEHHPLPKFQKAGIPVAVYHFLAHVIYGLSIGFLYIFLLSGKGLVL